MYTESHERKRSCLKSFLLTEIFDIDFPFSLPHFFTCRSIPLLVNVTKGDNDLPHFSAISNRVSAGNGWFIFCNRRLEILVGDMIFDEICTAHSPVCLSYGLGPRFYEREKITSSISAIPYSVWRNTMLALAKKR